MSITVTENIGILAARVKLGAIHGAHGQLIHNNLNWTLIRHNKKKPAAENTESQQYQLQGSNALLDVPAGEYLVTVTFKDKLYDLGKLTLIRNTATDAIYILENAGDYHHNEDTHYEMRKEQREGQRKFGSASESLREPQQNQNQAGELSQSSVLPHPALTDKTQFDGAEQNVSQTTETNKNAVEFSHKKQHAAKLTAQKQSAPSYSPMGG